MSEQSKQDDDALASEPRDKKGDGDGGDSGGSGRSVGFHPAPREEWTMISQGAEARVWKVPTKNDNAETKDGKEQEKQQQPASSSSSLSSVQYIICKERFSKSYRHPDLDERLTKSRCRSEAKVLEKCTKKSNIRVPKVIRVEPPKLYLEYIHGPTIKSYLKQLAAIKNGTKNKKESNGTDDDELEKLANKIGILVGKLHNLGVIHGDLTTSNIMMSTSGDQNTMMTDQNGDGTEKEKDASTTATASISAARCEDELLLIDFGLAKSTFSIEEQAVDLYVLERALQSTHPELQESFFDLILKSYSETTMNKNSKQGSEKKSQTTLQRLEQVRQRGRKRECFG